MSIRAMDHYWNNRPDITSQSELMVLLALADWSDDNGRCFPSYAAIAAKCRKDRRSVMRTVSALVKRGEIKVEKRRKRGTDKNQSNVYTLVSFAGGDVVSLVTDLPLGSGKNDTTSSGKNDTRVVVKMSPGTVTRTTNIEPSQDTFVAANADDTPDTSPPVVEVEEEEPKPLTDQQQWFEAICWCCGYDHRVISKKDAARVGTVASKLRKADYTLDDLRFWYKSVWSNDWRAKKGRPTPEQITETIGRMNQPEEQKQSQAERLRSMAAQVHAELEAEGIVYAR